jgi:phenylpropionate dioxygenase-like ring-hydroxylating dioxygenase large terminal subunit
VTPFDELVTERRVHRSVYTDEAFFALEMVKVFGATWTYVAHESEIPGPDDFVRRDLGRRPVIVTRGGDMAIHVLLNRCSHRAATVCRIDEGTAKRFTCPYHGWTFANDGACVGVPLPGAYGPAFDKSTLALGQARAESYRGFIFATLNPDEPRLVDHLGPVTGRLDEWIDRAGGRVVVRHGAHRLVYHGNWKLAVDNSGDGYHPGYSHKSLLAMRKERYGPGVDMQYVLNNVDVGRQYVQDLGRGHHFLDQRDEIESYWPQAAPSPGREAYEAVLTDRLGAHDAEPFLESAVGSGMNLNVFPNLLIIGNQIQVVEPQAVDRTQLTWYATTIGTGPDEISSIRMRLQEDFPSFGEPDDLANFEEVQRGLAVPEMEWIMTDRHLDSGTETVSEDGLLTGKVTDELTLRAFWRRWRELMGSDQKLEAK